MFFMDFKLRVKFDDRLTRTGRKRFSLIFEGDEGEGVAIQGFMILDEKHLQCPSFFLKDGTPFSPVRLTPEIQRGLLREIGLHEISKEEGLQFPGTLVHTW